MRLRISILYILALVVLLAGCGSLPGTTSDHPAEEAGIRLSDAYEALHYNYQATYDNVSPEQREYMRENIAPGMNELKDKIVAYNEAVLLDGEAPERRRVLLEQLRALSTKIYEIKEQQNDLH